MLLIALLGRSGSGKSTLERNLVNYGFNRIISYTTRPMRKGEENHREYHFITKEQFDKLYDQGIIIEKAEYSGNYYGAPNPFGNMNNVIVVEPDGLKALKEKFGSQVVSIYIDVSDAELNRRLALRNNTTDIASRKEVDDVKFRDIEKNVDYVIDGNGSIESMVQAVLIALELNN